MMAGTLWPLPFQGNNWAKVGLGVVSSLMVVTVAAYPTQLVIHLGAKQPRLYGVPGLLVSVFTVVLLQDVVGCAPERGRFGPLEGLDGCVRPDS